MIAHDIKEATDIWRTNSYMPEASKLFVQSGKSHTWEDLFLAVRVLRRITNVLLQYNEAAFPVVCLPSFSFLDAAWDLHCSFSFRD